MSALAPEAIDGRAVLYCGDCLVVLPTLAENSIDSCVCDPPYHLTSIVKRFGADNAAPAKAGKTGAYARASAGFMGKKWDGGDIAFRPETWTEVLRVLKPGAYLLAFSSTRTFGRMQVACEDAGFITHPFIAWIFGQGFPKATRVDDDAWEGWRYGTQSLKPAIEPIYVGQKPFEKGLTGTENIRKWGVGAVNIDGCRVATSVTDQDAMARVVGFNKSYSHGEPGTTLAGSADGSLHKRDRSEFDATRGRWPANVIHDGSDEVLAAFPDLHGAGHVREEPGGGTYVKSSNDCDFGGIGIGMKGFRIGDSGSAARFFYSAKADDGDRLGSKHPTVKPVDLIAYLVRLITPKRGTVLDLFAGTGTTGEAAYREGMRSVLIEREEEYQADIRRRMKLAMAGPDERARETVKAKMKGKPVDNGPLFNAGDETPEAAE